MDVLRRALVLFHFINEGKNATNDFLLAVYTLLC